MERSSHAVRTDAVQRPLIVLQGHDRRQYHFGAEAPV